MPKIVIKNLDNKTIVSNDNTKTVLSLIHQNGIDWMHACGKKGRCTTCKMIVEEGMENLEELTDQESRFREMKALKPNERLTCQAILNTGTIVIKVPEVGKLPHLNYT